MDLSKALKTWNTNKEKLVPIFYSTLGGKSFGTSMYSFYQFLAKF